MIPQTVLVACESFDGGLDAAQVARAIGCGLRAGDCGLEVDLSPLNRDSRPRLNRDSRPRLSLDSRLRRARAVVIATARLDYRTLLTGGAVCEIATSARQNGVPCYAIAGRKRLDPFEARILDLQIVLEADGELELKAAGRRLAELL